jgi:polyadenylate-binding protein
MSVNDKSIFVGDLAREIGEQDLYTVFSRVGNVTSIHVCRDVTTKKSLGYAYVNYQEAEAAKRAFETINGSEIAGRACHVSFVQRDPTMRKTGVANIVAKNLPKTVTLETVRSLFADFGRIMSLRLPMNPKTKEPRGIAYINFETKEQAAKAIADANNKEIAGETVTVEPWKNPAATRELQKEQFTNTFIRNLRADTTQENLREWFGKYGEITSCAIRPALDNTVHGFVSFKTHEEAAAFVTAVNDSTEFAAPDQQLAVMRFMSKRERKQMLTEKRRERDLENQKYANVYMKNLDEDVTSEKLKEVFSKYGDIVSAYVAKDRATNISRGFGFVSFREKKDADAAIGEMSNTTMLSGGTRPLFICYAMRKDVRHAQIEEARKQGFSRQAGPMGYPMGPMGMGMGPMGMQGGMGPMQGGMGMGGAFPRTQWAGQAGQFGGPQGGFAGANPMLQQQQQMLFQQQQAAAAAARMAMLPQQQAAMMGRPAAMAAPMAPRPQPPMPAQPARVDLASQLASMTPEAQKNALGERLYERISAKHPSEASKVTGMLLEMDNAEILLLLQDPAQLDGKIAEALDVLRKHTQ